MSSLFSPLTLRGVTFRNRAWVAPMCQYTSVDGHPGDWHLVHLGGLARGGAGLVITEATAVTADGRISPQDAGIWTDAQALDYQRITRFVREQGSVPGIQLAHAGRKASTYAPWRGRGSVPLSEGGWPTVAPSAVAFDGYAVPSAIDLAEIPALVRAWADAARRAVTAGFEVIEIHAAHGYLLNQFLSPSSNRRTDGYGGDLGGRSRLLIEIVDAVRAVIPESMPLFVRVSATEWVPDGLDVDEVAEIAKTLAGHGVDLIDTSSGGNNAAQQVATGPGYQVPFAEQIKQVSGLRTGAVGLITEPAQAEKVLAGGSADAIFLGRALLSDPNWPLHAAFELGADVTWPPQYERGRPA